MASTKRNSLDHMSHIMRKPVYDMRTTKAQFSLCICEVCTFVVCCLDSIILLVSISELSSLYQASVATQAGLCQPCSQTSKNGYVVTWLIQDNNFADQQQAMVYDIQYRLMDMKHNTWWTTGISVSKQEAILWILLNDETEIFSTSYKHLSL